MPDLNYSVNALVTKGALTQSFNAANITADISTVGMIAVTLNLGTATTQIGTATMNALGLCYARNLATSTVSTHTVSFGRLSGTTLFETVRLRSGEAAMFRLAPGDYAAKGSAADLRLLVNVIED